MGAARIASIWGIAVAAAVLALPCQAGVRKCTDAAGRVIYQDVHCAPAPAPASPATPDTTLKPAVSVDLRVPGKAQAAEPRREPAPPAQGAWRGAAQFRYVSGAPLDASADAEIELALMPDGRLEGGAVAAGCRLDGVHAPQQRLKNNVVAVDVIISGCRDARFNARYAGQLDATNPARSRLRLHAITAISAVTADGYRELSMATIDAALRR